MTHFLIFCVILAIMITIGGFILNLLFTVLVLTIGGIASLVGMIIGRFRGDGEA